jgi:peptidoglycan/LPS O-acetylase OafA/YrhL
MLHSLGLTHALSWNGPSWSVSAEWIAYSVLFAPMVFLLRHVRIIYVAVLATVLWTSLILLTALVLKSHVGDLTTNGVLRIVPEFLAGYLLFRLLQTQVWRWGDLVSGAGLLLVVTVAFFASKNTWMLLPAVMTLLGGLYTGGCFSDRIFGNRLMILLGNASYSIYLVQTLVFIGAHQIARRMHLVEDVPLALFETALVAVAGVLVFRYIEEPSRQRLLRFFKRNLTSPDRESLIQSGLPDRAETTSVVE